MTTLSVLYLDDDEHESALISRSLERTGKVTVARRLARASELPAHLEAARRGRTSPVDVLLVDAYLDPTTTEPAHDLFRALSTSTLPLVAISRWARGPVVLDLIASGAWTVLQKDMSPDRIADVLLQLHGEHDHQPDSPTVFMSPPVRRATRALRSIGWNDKERRALQMRDEGRKRADIGRALHITPKGVDQLYASARKKVAEYADRELARVIPPTIGDLLDGAGASIDATAEVARALDVFYDPARGIDPYSPGDH